MTLIGATEDLVHADLGAAIWHDHGEVLAHRDALIVPATRAPRTLDPTRADEGGHQRFDAGMPVPLTIGGHQHQALTSPVYVDNTAIVAAGYYRG